MLINGSDQELLRAGGLDGYFFLRYLKKSATILAVGAVVTIPLMVINAVPGLGETNDQKELDMISMSNVKESNR